MSSKTSIVDKLIEWAGIAFISGILIVGGYVGYFSVFAHSSWEPGPTALRFMAAISYTGGVIPLVIAFLIPYVRRTVSRKVWITLSSYVLLHAVSFLPYFLALRDGSGHALEALWIPMPLGVVLFFLTCFVLIHFLLNSGNRSEGHRTGDE